MNFKTEKISSRVTRIYAFNTELMYLVEGEEKAALIDTGSGFGSLRSCVEKLTNKPLIVLLTHGHTDHAMGAAEFDTVYMNRKDDWVFGSHGKEDFRRFSMTMCPDYEKFTDADYIPTADCRTFLDLNDGDVFDLGGTSIEILGCPGHTRGSVTMLLREERMLLLGDACNGLTFLFDDFSTGVRPYMESLKRLKSLTDGRYDTVLLSHTGGEPCIDMIDGVIGVCEDILSGNVDDQPFELMGQKAKLAKAFSFEKGRLDGGSGNIVYSEATKERQN